MKFSSGAELVVGSNDVKGDTDTFLILTDAGKKRSNADDDIKAIQEDRPPKPLFLGPLIERSINIERVRSLLTNRPELAKIKIRTERSHLVNG